MSWYKIKTDGKPSRMSPQSITKWIEARMVVEVYVDPVKNVAMFEGDGQDQAFLQTQLGEGYVVTLEEK